MANETLASHHFQKLKSCLFEEATRTDHNAVSVKKDNLLQGILEITNSVLFSLKLLLFLNDTCIFLSYIVLLNCS